MGAGPSGPADDAHPDPKEDHVTTIREIRADEVGVVTDMYLELCRSLSERDADWGVPAREPIRRWIQRTTETDARYASCPRSARRSPGICWRR